MSTHTWQIRNYLSLIYRLEPVRKSLAWRRKVSGPIEQRKIGNIALVPEHLTYVITQSMELLAKFQAESPFKSP
jgi:hypothetical protein